MVYLGSKRVDINSLVYIVILLSILKEENWNGRNGKV